MSKISPRLREEADELPDIAIVEINDFRSMGKIGSRLREEAAVYCSAMACYMANDTIYDGDYDPSYDGTWSSFAVEIGRIARYSLDECHGYGALAWAEAEALLRTGWEP
jgi:hypothetical protein